MNIACCSVYSILPSLHSTGASEFNLPFCQAASKLPDIIINNQYLWGPIFLIMSNMAKLWFFLSFIPADN